MTCVHPNTNGFRVVADFDHLPRPLSSDTLADAAAAFGELLEAQTALECVVSLLYQLEDSQIRADYLRSLLDPHVLALRNVSNILSQQR